MSLGVAPTAREKIEEADVTASHAHRARRQPHGCPAGGAIVAVTFLVVACHR